MLDITKRFTLFREIFYEKPTEIIQYCVVFDQVFPKYFHISHVSRICQGFNYITHFTMFTMFHNVSRKICPKCFWAEKHTQNISKKLNGKHNIKHCETQYNISGNITGNIYWK